MIDGFHLLRPEALYALFALPLAAWLMARRKHRSGNWRNEIDPELLPWLLPQTAGQSQQGQHSWWPLLLLALVIGAIAGPSLERAEVPVFQRADALVIVLDLSDSMRANDIQPSRAERARQKILDVLAARDEGVTGLVAYAGDAHVVTPLTDDQRTIENLLPALTPDIMPIPGANTEAALREAMALITAAGMANGRILLLTDGMPRFDPAVISEELSLANIDVDILGIGTAQGAPMPLPEGGFVRDDSGEIVVPVLDSNELQRVASLLGADYQEVQLDNGDLESLTPLATADLVSEVSLERRTDTWIDHGYWLALLAAIGMLPLFRRGVLVLLLGIALAPDTARADNLWRDLWRTPDQQAATALAAGDAPLAAERFESSDWRGVAQFESGDYQRSAASFAELDNADSLYNRGNALAMAGDLPGALNAYNQSLEIAPDREDAINNRDLVQRLLEEQQQQQDQQNQDGEDDQSQQDNSDTEGDSESDDQQQNQDGESEQNSSQSDRPPEDSDPQQGQPQSGDPSADQQASSQDMQEAMEQQLEAQTAAQMRKFDQALEDQQKLEQWLRRVPDEPGGLLRNKFRYQSIQRLKKGEKPDEDIRW